MKKIHEKTKFFTSNWLYCYQVMPLDFCLKKNVRATYQRLANKIFSNLIDKTMQVYIKDMLIKSAEKKGHIHHL